MQRVALLKGTNINKDHDLSKISEALMTAGVIEGLLVTSGSVAVGFAFIEVLRAGKKIRVMFESDAAVTIDTTGTKKVFVSIDQTKVDDGSSNAVDGTGIGSIQTAASYPASNFVPLASITSGVITDERSFIKPTAIEDRGTLLKNPILSSKSANYTLLSTEKNNTVFSMDTSGGNRTFTLNPALFPTTNGCFVFTFTKSTSDANTVTIDVGSGNTIDGSQTYVLTQQNESVTIVIQSSTFAKVLCTDKKPVTVSVSNFQSSLVAGENITADRMVRMGKLSNEDSSVGTTDILQNTGGAAQPFSGDNTNFEAGQGFITTVEGFIKEITLWITKTGTTASGLCSFNLEVFSDAGFTSLVATSTNTILAGAVNATETEITFNFTGIKVLNGQNLFFKVNKVDLGLWTNGPYNISRTATSVYSPGNAYSLTSTGVVSSLTSFDLRFRVRTQPSENPARIYQTHSAQSGKIDYIGVALNSATSGNSVIVETGAGAIVAMTGLIAGQEYFLNGAAGQIANTSGTLEKKVGIALSTTSLFLYENTILRRESTSFLASRDLSLVTGTITYSHNLGRVPKLIQVSSRNSSTINSQGVFSENGQQCIYIDGSGSFADSINAIRMHTTASAFVTGFIQNITATSFDVVYTRTSNPTGTAQILFLLQ